MARTRTGLFNERDPASRIGGSDVETTPLSSIPGFGLSPDSLVTVYRGVPTGVSRIDEGDWVTLSPQLARDYAGTGRVLSMRVRAGDILTEPGVDDFETAEAVYSPPRLASSPGAAGTVNS